MIDIQEKKRQIISFLEINGPSLPIRIAKAIEMDPMVATAITSELTATNKVKTSNLKIGSSFLYLIPGQEEQLENFTENLKSVEKNVVEKLKEKRILIDEKEEPVTRVALRNVKDFAKPFKYQDKIMWKYAFATDTEIKEILKKPKEEIKEKVEKYSGKEISKEEKIKEPEEDIQKPEETTLMDVKGKDEENNEEKDIVPKAWEVKKEEIQIKKEKTKPKENEIENIFSNVKEEPESEFLKEVKGFLKKKDIDFIEEIRTEKKEIMAKVKISSQLGDINMLLIAKDKKTTNKDEIRASIQMATKTDMPCLLLIRKEATKSVQKIIESNSLIKLLAIE